MGETLDQNGPPVDRKPEVAISAFCDYPHP
jgi:hypothetical protein